MYLSALLKPRIDKVGYLTKMFRIMKLTTVLLIAVCLQVSAEGNSQKITLKEYNIPLQKVFEEIRSQTNYYFFYADEVLASAKKVTVYIKNGTIKEVLDLCFKNQPLTYTILEKTIFIKRKVFAHVANVLEQSAAAAITGKVTNPDGVPLVGVSVTVKGTNVGASTDGKGYYSIDAPQNGTLTFSYVGYATVEIEISNRKIINVQLQEDNKALNEVVVTALGIERKKASLSYTTQSISSDDITKAKSENFVNSLAGKAAGVVVTRGTGGPGSAARVILRGVKSFTGSSAPLYVIDGIPMSTMSGGTGGSLFTGLDGGADDVSKINPDNIANIEVLKGAAASALYGSEAANGVILITTKQGQAGSTKILFTSTASMSNPISLPDIQTSYGRTDSTANDSWGAKITNGDNSHIKRFFNTGTDFINSISFSGGSQVAQFYASYAYTKAKGIVPNNDLARHNFDLRGTARFLNNKLSVDVAVNYIDQNVNNRPRAGFYQSPVFSLYLFPPDDDFSNYRDHFEVWNDLRGLYQQNWPYIRNEASTNQNPYWIQYRNLTADHSHRTFFKARVKYDILNWLNVQMRASYNTTTDQNDYRNYASTDPVTAGAAGALSGTYGTSTGYNNSLYYDILANATRELNENFSLTATLGFSNRQDYAYGLDMSSNGSSGLIYPNVFTVSNFVFPFDYLENEDKGLSQAIFGTATLAYKQTFFLEGTARNEWSFTSPEKPFFYPSVGLSYILSNTIPTTRTFSFAKVRASYAEVGSPLAKGVNERDPNYTINTATGTINGSRTFPYFNGTDTANLVPERTSSFELGTDVRLFNNKLSLALTYYDAYTSNQVFSIEAPTGSGAQSFMINGGIIRNYGFEGIVSYNARLGNNIHWQPSLNFSRNVNQIRQLSDLLNTDRFVVGSSNNTRLFASFLYRPKDGKYTAFGDLFGKTIERNEDGSIKTDNQGLPVLSKTDANYVGNPNAKFLAGFNNTFSYKRYTLSFLIDSRFGGDAFSLTETWLDFKGLSQRTADARDNGGVVVNGKTVSAKDYYLRISGGGNYAAVPQYRYSATNIRLRELSIGYSFPFGRNQKLDLSLTGNNLFFFYKDAPFDPETAVSTGSLLQNLDAFGVPATRSIGVNLRLSL